MRRVRLAPGEGRLEEVLQSLAKQQRTLDGLVGMQGELRGLLEQQHNALQKRMAAFGPTWTSSEHNANDSIEHNPSHSHSQHADEHNEQRRRSSASSLNIFRAHKKEGTVCSTTATKRVSVVQPPKSLGEWRAHLRTLLKHPRFDTILGVLILLNFLLLFAQLEWRGHILEGRLEGTPFTDLERAWRGAEPIFGVLDQGFSLLFFVEMLCNLFVFGCVDCFTEWVRLLDYMAVVVSVLDSFLLESLGQQQAGVGLRLLKVMRAFRLLRFLRVLRFMGVCSGLRVLVQTLSKSLGSLLWSMAVVGFLILSSGLFISILVQDILQDEGGTLEPATRAFLFRYYGGALRSTYTMFEATFSAKWATHFSEQLIWDVSPWFMAFWVLYTVTVNFAVIRVLSALFLKQTLDVAAIDAERMAVAKLREKEKIVDTLRAIFKLGDVEGDGVLAPWEFEEMMQKDEVKAMFEDLELEEPELQLLYSILSEDDGVADQEEFLAGALKLKTQVKTVDIVQLLHEMFTIKRQLSEVSGGLGQLHRCLRAGGSPATPCPGVKAPGAVAQLTDRRGVRQVQC